MIQVGSKVDVIRKGRTLFSGTLVAFEDDADTQIANVEHFARVQNERGDVLVFRRPAKGFDFSDSGWIAKSKAKARKWGYVSIRRAKED
jgi:hypothetical protein